MKVSNEYADILPWGILATIPKTVIAALLISEYLNRLDIPADEVYIKIMDEWQTLYANGIIPQKPPKETETP